ncbi:MAG TPA: flagellar hook-length control protein FliK [Xanthobacteraceae bacterium]|nr:flagellar hook-length control protein FliK [Xanthobacteraceae bacterium]
MSSTASNVSVTPAVAPSPWPQAPAATQDNALDDGGGPFAALVDAAAAAPDTTNPQPVPQPVAPRAFAAPDQSAAKFSSRRDNGATGTAQNTTPQPQAPAGATKTTNPVASSNATANPSATQNATANQAGTTAPADTTGTALDAFAGKAATIVTDATANAATADATTKPASDNGNQDDGGSATDADAAAATNVQPVATAIVANTIINTPSAAAATAPGAVIGGSAAAGATSALAFVNAKNAGSSQDAGNPSAAPDANSFTAGHDTDTTASAQDAKIAIAAQDAKVAVPVQTAKAATPAQGAKATAAGKQTSSTGSNAPAAGADNTAAASPADATNAQTWNGGAAPQVQARADSDTIITSQNGGSATTHIDALAATPTSEQSGWNAAKAATEGLPSFGIVANQTAPAIAAATPGTAAAATVPIAGLAVAIASRAQAGSSQFDIRLDPPELGRIDVRLDVDRGGQVTSHVTVDRADTLQLLQSQQPQLERALEQAGLKTADNGLQFTLRDQSFAGQNGSGGSAQPSVAQLVIPDAEAPVIQATQIYSRAGLGSGVDIRV